MEQRNDPVKLEDIILAQMNCSGAFTYEIGIRITEIGNGVAKGCLSPALLHRNPIGTIHGGVIFSLMDAVGGAAGASTGLGCATVDCDIHFLRAVKAGEAISCQALILKNGRQLIVCDVEVENERNEVAAKGTFTYQKMKPVTDYCI